MGAKSPHCGHSQQSQTIQPEQRGSERVVHKDQIKCWTFSRIRAHRRHRGACPKETETNEANPNPDENDQIPQIDLVLPGDRGIENMSNELSVLRRSLRINDCTPVKLRDDYAIGSMHCVNQYYHV